MTVRALVSMCALFFAASADAEPARGGVALNWVRLEGAEDCPFVETLAARVEAKVDRRIFVAPGRSEHVLEGQIERASHGFRARVRLLDRSGKELGVREVKTTSPSCEAFGEELVFVVSLLVRDEQAAPEPEPRREIVTVSVPTPVETVKVIEKEPAFRIAPAVAGVLGAGWGSDPGWGAQARISIEPQAFVPVYASATYVTMPTVRAETVRASLSTLLGHVGVCPIRFWSKRVSLCGGVAMGTERSRGEGLPRTSADDVFVAGGELEARVAITLAGPVQWTLGLAGVVPVSNRSIVYRDRSGQDVMLASGGPVRLIASTGFGLLLPEALR